MRLLLLDLRNDSVEFGIGDACQRTRQPAQRSAARNLRSGKKRRERRVAWYIPQPQRMARIAFGQRVKRRRNEARILRRREPDLVFRMMSPRSDETGGIVRHRQRKKSR